MANDMMQTPFTNQSFDFTDGKRRDIEKSTGVDDDFEASRRNLMKIMETTSGAINSLSLIAFQSQDPEAYDVLNKMIKTYSDQQSQLLQMYRIKEAKDARQATASQQGTVQGEVVDNRVQNVFLGTPADLAKVLESMKTPEK